MINHKVYRAQWQRSRRKHVRCGHCKGPLPLLKGNGHRRGAHYGYCSPACFVEGKRADHRAYQRERVIGHGWAYLFRNPKQGVPRT
ncbi:MAG: hypothetical protein K2X43_01190 [Hyphomonadaceae bacterium]|nr:hypothetical protein [Hyphomonadaceae bacterium]